VLPYEQQYSWGTFPVLCSDGVTRRRSAAECVVVESGDPAPRDAERAAFTIGVRDGEFD